jgi:hypothetical protein
MTVAEIISLIANAGGSLGLAVFAIWMLNRVWEARLNEEKRHSDEMRQVWEQTRVALEANTKVLTQLSNRLERD